MTEKILLQALRNQRTSRVPFWFMRQAGRYLPEYRELRAQKGGFLDMVYDPKTACEITMQPIRRFGMDGAILFSDILVIPHALGQHLEFVPEEGPKLEPIKSVSDLKRLEPEGIHKTLEPVYGTISNVRTVLAQEDFGHVACIGFAGSPWTVACYMIEGGGSRDFMRTKLMACADPDLFQDLIDILVHATAGYLIRQVRAGAEVIQLFDSWAGVCDANQFCKWVINPTSRVVDLIRENCPDVPVIGFPKGAGVNIQTYISETGIDAVGLDSQVPPVWTRDNLQMQLPVQGNLDPVVLLVGGEALQRAAGEILDTLADRPFVFNLGHGIHKETPIAHVEKLIEMIKG